MDSKRRLQRIEDIGRNELNIELDFTEVIVKLEELDARRIEIDKYRKSLNHDLEIVKAEYQAVNSIARDKGFLLVQALERLDYKAKLPLLNELAMLGAIPTETADNLRSKWFYANKNVYKQYQMDTAAFDNELKAQYDGTR